MTDRIFGPAIEEIKRRAAKAGTSDEFEASLFENLDSYDLRDLEQALYEIILIGNLAGRAEVDAEAGENEADVVGSDGFWDQSLGFLAILLCGGVGVGSADFVGSAGGNPESQLAERAMPEG